LGDGFFFPTTKLPVQCTWKNIDKPHFGEDG